jgi:hypothetical protein
MSQSKGSKGKNLCTKPRKNARPEEIARHIQADKVRPFMALRKYREMQAAQDTKEEVA